MTDLPLSVIRHVGQFHDPMGVVRGHEDIFGRRVPLEEIQAVLRSASLNFWIGLVARIDRALFGRASDPARQVELARWAFLPSDWRALAEAERRDPEQRIILFHHQQLLARFSHEG